MKNDVPFRNLIDDLDMFMEVKFLYEGKTYSITYDDENSYIFDMSNPNELVSLPTERTAKLVDSKVFKGKSLKEIWTKIEMI